MLKSGTKKIITIASGILFSLISLHLIGVYIFAWGYYEWVRGGSISIGTIWTPPNVLDPFEYGKDKSSDLVYRFLFRGLVRYNMSTGIYQWDLTSCDLSDMTLIKCTMRDDAVWSDGTRVREEDVIESFNAFKKNSTQTEIKNFLSTVNVTKKGDTIEIKSSQKSPHMIEVLTYPIIKKEVIATIGSGTIDPKNYITSGPYILSETVLDKEYGFERITLVRNEKSSQSTWLDKIHFKFFKDISSLERGSETLSIVIPPAKNENVNLGPRFKEYTYTNYEYFSVFLNTDTMSRALRNSIHWQIGTSFSSGNINEWHTRVDNIFWSWGALLPSGTLKWFPDLLRDLGYTKKSEMIAKLNKESTTVSGELVFPNTKYWTNKAKVNTLFVNEDPTELILTGNVPLNTESVTINGYTLREFSPGNKIFVYKASTIWGTLAEWKNVYNMILKLSNGNSLTEALTVYISKDQSKLDGYKKELQDAYNASQNTPALIANREREKVEQLKKLEQLRDEYYYNDKYEIFSLKIGHITGPQSTEAYAEKINTALKLLWVKTELVPYGPKDIQSIIASWEKKYDLLVIGISVEWSLSNIGKLFASSDAKWGGLNFSNIESKNLDSLFIEFRGTTESSKLDKIQQGIIKIMNTESFFVPISSPYHKIWVDRNIKWIPQVDIIPDIASFVDVFVGTSIKEKYIRNSQNKNISGFFGWIGSQF